MSVAKFRTATCLSLLAVACAAAGAWRLRADETPAGAKSESGGTKNLYLAREGLSPEKLLDFIDRMKDKPKSLRSRPGFSEAILDAADRILASDADSTLKGAAVCEKIRELHYQACRGDAQADIELREMAASLTDRAAGPAADELRFIQLEARVLAADDLPADQLPPLLEEVRAYFNGRTPEARDLRMASATVRMINRLQSDDEADKAYHEFGALFARSTDREMSRYGRKIEKGAKPASLVGKPIEITGTLVNGLPLDEEAYRGKIVLLDFWATWCGPCRAELPNVKALYEQYHARGFEVIGVSLDTEREALEEFLEEEHIAWPNLFAEGEEVGWKHPLAAKLNVNAIPATFLLDRDGKVIAENVRGPELGARLAALFPESDGKPAEEAPPEESPPGDG